MLNMQNKQDIYNSNEGQLDKSYNLEVIIDASQPKQVFLPVIDQIVPPTHLYSEAINPNVTVFAGRDFKKNN